MLVELLLSYVVIFRLNNAGKNLKYIERSKLLQLELSLFYSFPWCIRFQSFERFARDDRKRLNGIGE